MKKFFDAITEARKGHKIKFKNERYWFVWDFEKGELIYENDEDRLEFVISDHLFEQDFEVEKAKRNIIWAAEQMDKGLEVRRDGWPNKGFRIRKTDDGSIMRPDSREWSVAGEDLKAEDWELY